MNKTEYREAIRVLISAEVGDLSLDDRISIVQQCIIDAQKEAGFDESNKGNPWSDEELRLVLLSNPTKENCMVLARAFKRGYGSIEQIYRWAASSKDEVAAKRADDSFIQQIKRVAKQVGWRAT